MGKVKRTKSDKKSESKGKSKKSKKASDHTPSGGFSLLADEKAVDSALSSLFAAKPTSHNQSIPAVEPHPKHQKDDQDIALEDQDTSTIAVGDTAGQSPPSTGRIASPPAEEEHGVTSALGKSKRKRKRHDDGGDLEDAYMRKLATEETEEDDRVDQERGSKRSRSEDGQPVVIDGLDQDLSDIEEAGIEVSGDLDDQQASDNDNDELDAPPQHETQLAASSDLDRAGRTVFLGNVSTTAITSRSAGKTLQTHLTSFFEASKDSTSVAKLESIRFRSTPYAPTLPKKAAFARKEVVNATTHATNAYAVYSSSSLAREAVRRLNGTIVLDRHLRVDSVAHPAPTAHKRCVFVGNLGFVDDESNITAANEAAGWEKRKTKQAPADVEEGLWRLFKKYGTVESVRVIRDKGTRVGKGIAYVQFTDEVAVEGALAEDGKKDPPRLPRRLRVTRAKAMKRNAKNNSTKPDRHEKAPQGYRRKISSDEATQRGRVGKLMGKAAAALSKDGEFIRRPESFIFEGHRASVKQGKSGFKLGKGTKKKGKPTTRSAKRGAAYKASKPRT